MTKPKKCTCMLVIPLVGEECRYCQPQEYIDELEDAVIDGDIEAEKLRAQVSALRNLCERLQHCAQWFYLDQGDYGHMEAIMMDYHGIMRASGGKQ